jgi:multidrug efflux system outer membrane protein
MSMSFPRTSVLICGTLALMTGCSVGPDYVQPSAPQPAGYSESGPWKKADPKDDISKGDWYKIFHDSKLNELEGQAVVTSQTLMAAIARVSEERALARETEAAFFPDVNFEGSYTRQRTSPNNGQLAAQSPAGSPPLTVTTPGGPVTIPGSRGGGRPYTFNSATVVPFDLSYEVDIWGKIRRSFESAGDTAQATVADYENVLLGLKADVATTYFAIRTADSEIDVQVRSIKSFQDNLNLTNSRFQGGISTQLDVDQAEATLAAAQAQLATLRSQRATLEHGLAVLLGLPPEGFKIAYHPLDIAPPSVPAGMPSDLLERRPDVAAAERRCAAQNAKIGVAISAYFPVVNLTGSTGFDSGDLGLLFNWQSRIWSYGPNIQFPIFEGGQISAQVKQEKASYEENVANYRETVLTAFQNVEDSLSSLRYQAEQQEAQDRAYKAYKAALDLTNARYTTGLVSYFDVIQAQGLELTAEQTDVQVRGNRIATTVQLVKALGGGWADSYVSRPSLGNHVDAPSQAPTVLTPNAEPAARP